MRAVAQAFLLASLAGVVSVSFAQDWDFSADGTLMARDAFTFGEMIAEEELPASPAPLPLDGSIRIAQAGPEPPQNPGDSVLTGGFVTLEQFESLQSKIASLEAAGNTPIAAPAVQATPAPAKKFPDLKVTGFFQADSAYFEQDDNSIATLGDIQDGVGFRRARIAAAGNISPRASYLMEFDFAQAQSRFVDVWGQINDTPLGNMRIGRFRQPFGMTELTSVRELPTLERPTVFAISPFRQTGIMFFDTMFDEQMTYAFSGFRGLSDNFGNVYSDSGYGTAERLTGLLVDGGDTQVVHVGGGHAYVSPGLGTAAIITQDELFVGQGLLALPGLSPNPITNVPPFINTGFFPVEDYHSLNVEGAVSLGRALIQSEYRWSDYNLANGQSEIVHGGYAHVRYVWTGEVIPYNRAGSVFGRISPKRPLNLRCGDFGAWESVAQVSFLDATNLFGQPGVGPRPSRLTSTSLAMNWYWFTNAKAQFEYINGRLADPTFGASDTNTFASRVQFDF